MLYSTGPVVWPRILEKNVGVRNPGSNSSSQVNNNDLTLGKLLNLVFFCITRGLTRQQSRVAHRLWSKTAFELIWIHLQLTICIPNKLLLFACFLICEMRFILGCRALSTVPTHKRCSLISALHFLWAMWSYYGMESRELERTVQVYGSKVVWTGQGYYNYPSKT